MFFFPFWLKKAPQNIKVWRNPTVIIAVVVRNIWGIHWMYPPKVLLCRLMFSGNVTGSWDPSKDLKSDFSIFCNNIAQLWGFKCRCCSVAEEPYWFTVSLMRCKCNYFTPLMYSDGSPHALMSCFVLCSLLLEADIYDLRLEVQQLLHNNIVAGSFSSRCIKKVRSRSLKVKALSIYHRLCPIFLIFHIISPQTCENVSEAKENDAEAKTRSVWGWSSLRPGLYRSKRLSCD